MINIGLIPRLYTEVCCLQLNFKISKLRNNSSWGFLVFDSEVTKGITTISDKSTLGPLLGKNPLKRYIFH